MSEPFIGEVDLYGFQFVPQNWADCGGAILQISQNQALFSLLGAMYGGDGRSTFALPDLRGYVAQSHGNHPGSSFDWDIGQKGGVESHVMSEKEMPQHAHTASFTAATSSTAKVNIQATTETGGSATPSEGAYLSQTLNPNPGPDKPEKIYKSSPTAGSTVNLGGVTVSGGGSSSGSVVVSPNGSNKAFSLTQSGLILNYSIALKGLFPSRN